MTSQLLIEGKIRVIQIKSKDMVIDLEFRCIIDEPSSKNRDLSFNDNNYFFILKWYLQVGCVT